MRGNRFYTPSLPQYTSQFVEDKTPWGEMLALEDMKINRMDKAEETKAQTDAMMSSLIGGSRTQEITPQVAMEYKTKLDEWVKNHGNSSYTVPALRELSKIRAAFQNDPDVKLIIQDREAEKEYDFYKRDPSYPQMVDPNIDPETRQVRQFQRGDQFTPYARPADINAFIDQYTKDIKPRTVSGEKIIRVKDEVTGEEHPVLKQTQQTVIDDSDFDRVRPELMDALLQNFGSYLSEEELANRVQANIEKRKIDQRSSDVKFIPGYGQGSGRREPEGEKTFTWEGANVKLLPRNQDVSAAGAELSRSKNTGLWIDNKIMKINPEYYNTYRDDPAMLMNPNTDPEKGMVFKTAQFTGGRASKAMIEQRWLEDPAGTEAMFNEYFDEAEVSAKNYVFRNRVKDDRQRFEKIIENAKKDYKIDDQPYHNDVDLDMALNYIYENYDAATPAAQNVFQKFAQGDTDITQHDWFTLKAAGMKGRKESSDKTFNPKIETLPKDIYDSFKHALTGFTNSKNEIIQADGEPSGIFSGARMFDPDKQGEEITGNERKKLLAKGASFILDGYLPNGTHPWKTFILAATVSGKRVYIEGPEKMTINGRSVDLREQARFTNNVFTFELPGGGGTGDLFSVKNINVDNLMDMQVVDDDNEKKSNNSFDQGVVMRVQRSYRGSDLSDLSESQARPGGNMKLIVYQKDIRGDIESPFNAPLTEENLNGYVTFDIPTDAAGRINDFNARYVAADAFIRMMVLKGRLTEQQGSVLMTKLVMNFGSIENE